MKNKNKRSQAEKVAVEYVKIEVCSYIQRC